MPVVTKAELEELITSTALADSTRNSEIGAKVLAAWRWPAPRTASKPLA